MLQVFQNISNFTVPTINYKIYNDNRTQLLFVQNRLWSSLERESRPRQKGALITWHSGGERNSVFQFFLYLVHSGTSFSGLEPGPVPDKRIAYYSKD